MAFVLELKDDKGKLKERRSVHRDTSRGPKTGKGLEKKTTKGRKNEPKRNK